MHERIIILSLYLRKTSITDVGSLRMWVNSHVGQSTKCHFFRVNSPCTLHEHVFLSRCPHMGVWSQPVCLHRTINTHNDERLNNKAFELVRILQCMTMSIDQWSFSLEHY